MANTEEYKGNNPLPSQPGQEKANSTLLLTVFIIAAAAAVIAVIGFCFMNRPDNMLEGQVEGTTVRISGKLPGRVMEFYAHEGDTVHAGDTLVRIHSALFEAQLMQAEAMQDVARQQNRKIDGGTRRQIVQGAYDLWQQAKAAEGITRKTYERLQRLYEEGVMTEQKRDEAKAAYDAAVAAERAAKSQYDLAVAGAQSEDKQSAAAMVTAATGNVDQVKAVLDDAYLTSPCDGTIDQVYPEVGELVSLGAPIMSVLKSDNRHVVFNLREELLRDFPAGKRVTLYIPALDKDIEAEVYYIRDMGNYATWRATKTTGSWDSRTFEVKLRPTDSIEGLRPGMSAIYK
ncbi:MAG: efflux RND transporter periplasmic adaptor subunit [Muribaculaceae bacterium]|nr:efflux RND transporter periplasmic adaptor subunit [Muribaculaceae bacterium]MBP3638488.1 efflux RND transporter periplasmic adaptor subunit [Muribaculaceae bacterium]